MPDETLVDGVLMGGGDDVQGYMLACSEAHAFFGFKVGLPSALLPAVTPITQPGAQTER